MSSKKVWKACSPSRTKKPGKEGIVSKHRKERGVRRTQGKQSVPVPQLEQPTVAKWPLPATEGQQFYSRPNKLKDCCEAEMNVSTSPTELDLVYDLFKHKLNLRIVGSPPDNTLLELLRELKDI